MSGKPFHLGWFLQGSSAQAWGEPWTGHIGSTWMFPELFIDVARALERACFDYVLLEDSSYVGESWAGSTEIYLKHGIAVPRQDPSVVASLMVTATSRIGIVPTFGTYAYPPYLLARLMATLDQVSAGRAGWNVVTGSSDYAAMNFGMPGMPEHDLRYDMADEYMDVVDRLWGTWQPGAIIADAESGVLIDHTKVHAANFEGRWYNTRGPLNSGPCVQERPVIAQAGGSPRGREFAARHADTIVAHPKGVGAMKSYRDDVRARMTAHGRDPDGCKVLFLVAPILGETDVEAQERKRMRAARAAEQIEQRLAFFGKLTNIDFSVFDLDQPLSGVRAEHQWSSAEPRSVYADGRQSHACARSWQITAPLRFRLNSSGPPIRSPRAWARLWKKSAVTDIYFHCQISAAARWPRSRTASSLHCSAAVYRARPIATLQFRDNLLEF